MKEESRQSAIPLSSRVSTLVCGILKLHIRHDAARRFSAYRSVLTKCASSNSPRWTSTERRRARDQTPCRPRMAKNDLLPTLLPGERLVAKTRHRYWSLGRVQLFLLSRLLRHLPDCFVCSFSSAMEAGNPPRCVPDTHGTLPDWDKRSEVLMRPQETRSCSTIIKGPSQLARES